MLYHFNAYALDLVRGCLRVDGQEVNLRPKCFEVLRYLVQNPERLILKEELIEVVWPNTIVTDDSLTNCIGEVRRAIGDRDQNIIKTVPRRGYIFTAAATVQEPVDHSASPAARAVERTLPGQPSIAVLAFTNMSGDLNQEYFSDGVAEDIITELSRFRELLVIARNSSFQYKGKTADVRQIGRELGVMYVLEGSVRRHEQRVRITAQLVDAVTGAHRWAERYDRELGDVFALHDELARNISALLVAHVNKTEAQRTSLKPPAAWQAYDYYMRGADLYAAFYRSLRPKGLYEVRRLLERCIAIDPGYARAYATLANTYSNAFIMPVDSDYLKSDTIDRALMLARKAVQLDPNLPLAHSHLGSALSFKGEHQAAVDEFRIATVLNPNFSDWRYAAALVHAGQFELAIQVAADHLRVDPFAPPPAQGWAGAALYMQRKYSEALTPLRHWVAGMPKLIVARTYLAAAAAQAGLLDEARSEAAEILRMYPPWTIDGQARPLDRFKDVEHREHLYDGLRKAGLPDR